MKKGKMLYYMLPLILLVWGFVFFQFYSYFFSEPTYVIEEVKEIIDIDKRIKDTFTIVADYRDPFLGKKENYNGNRITLNTNSSSTGRSTQKKIGESWPVITYHGMIKNNNSDRRVGIVNIGGRERLVKKKDVVNEVVILLINKNTVKVRFQNENKTITK